MIHQHTHQCGHRGPEFLTQFSNPGDRDQPRRNHGDKSRERPCQLKTVPAGVTVPGRYTLAGNPIATLLSTA